MPKNKFTYNYGTNRDYEDRQLNQHYAERKTTEADIRAEEAESGQSLRKAIKERNKNLDRMNKATIDERKFNDQRLSYRTNERRNKEKRAEKNRVTKMSNDESKFTRAERYRTTTKNARQYQSADKSDRDWKSHKYLAKVKTRSGKVRYIYKDNRKTKSNGAELPEYNNEKITEAERKKWNDLVDDRRKLNRDERKMSGGTTQGANYRKVSSEERRTHNNEADRKTKLTRDERKFQNSQSYSYDSRIKRDEVNEDTRRGNKRAAVNPNSYTAGHSYTNDYVKEYGDTLISSL